MSKRVIHDCTFNHNGRVVALPNSKGRQGYYVEILVAMRAQLDAMLSHHRRVMVVRFDLRLYECTESNQCVSNFFRKCRKLLKRQYGLTRMGFLWCREQYKSEAQHYHCALILDGRKINHPGRVLKVVDDIWQGWGHVKPYIPKNCYVIVMRGDCESYEVAFLRLSYLGKVFSKNQRAKNVNDYSTSRISQNVSAFGDIKIENKVR